MGCALMLVLKFLPLVLLPALIWRGAVPGSPRTAVAWALAASLAITVYEGLVDSLFPSLTGWIPQAPWRVRFLLAVFHWGIVLAPAPPLMYVFARWYFAGGATLRLWLLAWIAAVIWAVYSRYMPSLLLGLIVT